MFDVGFTEVFLIGVVSLVVIGPERLPAVARTAGQWVAKMQRFVRGVKTDLKSELETGDLKKLIGDQREQIDELRQMVSSTKKDLQSTAQSVVKSTKEGLSELETSVNEAKADVAKASEAVVDKPPASSAGASASTPAEHTDNNPPASIDSPPAKRTGTTDSDSQ